jgi:hypothetical protein
MEGSEKEITWGGTRIASPHHPFSKTRGREGAEGKMYGEEMTLIYS